MNKFLRLFEYRLKIHYEKYDKMFEFKDAPKNVIKMQDVFLIYVYWGIMSSVDVIWEAKYDAEMKR